MTNEELDEARAKEAKRLWESFRDGGVSSPSIVAARLARENWTPPEPVDDVLAWREWAVTCLPEFRAGFLDGSLDSSRAAQAYLAGARMATEREQERAKGLVDRLSDLVERVTHDGKRDYVTGVNAGEMISARVVLAKYRGEA